MYACVIYTCENIKLIIPVSWIYEKLENIQRKKHYLAYYNSNKKKIAPPSSVLKMGSGKLMNNAIFKVFVYKLIGK